MSLTQAWPDSQKVSMAQISSLGELAFHGTTTIQRSDARISSLSVLQVAKLPTFASSYFYYVYMLFQILRVILA